MNWLFVFLQTKFMIDVGIQRSRMCVCVSEREKKNVSWYGFKNNIRYGTFAPTDHYHIHHVRWFFLTSPGRYTSGVVDSPHDTSVMPTDWLNKVEQQRKSLNWSNLPYSSLYEQIFVHILHKKMAWDGHARHGYVWWHLTFWWTACHIVHMDTRVFQLGVLEQMKLLETWVTEYRPTWWHKSSAYDDGSVFPVKLPPQRVDACNSEIEVLVDPSSWSGTSLYDVIAQQESIEVLLNDDDGDVVVVDCQNRVGMKMTVIDFWLLRHIHLLGWAMSQHSGGEAFQTWSGWLLLEVVFISQYVSGGRADWDLRKRLGWKKLWRQMSWQIRVGCEDKDLNNRSSARRTYLWDVK